MKKINYFFLVIVLLFCLSSSAQDKRPEVSNYCKVYVNNENLQVSTTRVGKVDDNEILIEFFGIDHPFDKKIFKAKIKEWDNNMDVTIQYESKDWVVMTKRSSSNWNDNLVVYLPNKGKKLSEFNISYSKDLSNQCKPEFLLTAFLAQKN